MTTVLSCYILFTVDGGMTPAQVSPEPCIARTKSLFTRKGNKNMHIILNNSSMVPVYEQLVAQLKQEIIEGGLAEGEALPSVRTFSNELKISALTVKKAYDKLEEEGFVVTVHGKGTYVAAMDRQLAVEARKKAVEEDFSLAVSKAKTVGLTDDEIREILEIILADN